MKVTWETKDIKVGLIVGSPNRAERWMIGYPAKRPMGCPKKFTLNSLSDGCVQEPMTVEEIVEKLNRSDNIPAELLP